MKKYLLIHFASIAIIAITMLCGCSSSPDPKVMQVSTIDALLAGAYDGVMSVKELKQHGDLGIGTVHQLDGELIVLDGEVYHVKSDGLVYVVPDRTTVPFASVVDFQCTTKIQVKDVPDFNTFIKQMASKFPNPNTVMAFRIHGKFHTVKTRSVPKQKKPYRPLVEVTGMQPEFQLKDVEGYLVGFRLPAYIKGINVPGWHLHFIDENKKVGGHVLAFDIDKAEVEACEIFDFRLILPRNSKEFQNADLRVDRSRELHKVESGRN